MSALFHLCLEVLCLARMQGQKHTKKPQFTCYAGQGEKEIAHAAPAKSSAGGQLSPRHSATDQPWTSRLTDAAVPELQADTQPALPVPAVTLAPTEVEPASKPVPRMADTILQVVSSVWKHFSCSRNS